jgi:flavin reductase (DIM6/NTAB) family NADH-FMN oxidoreductase RutF
MRQAVDLAHANRLINHGPTVLVSSQHEGRRNIMAAALAGPSTFTRELVLASGRFALNIPCRAIAYLTYTVGSTSGRDEDKFARYGIAAFSGTALALPLIEGCVAWLECRHIPEPHSEQAYDTFFGEVIAAQADARVFAGGRWAFDDGNTALHTLHHLGAGNFAVVGHTVQAHSLKGQS